MDFSHFYEIIIQNKEPVLIKEIMEQTLNLLSSLNTEANNYHSYMDSKNESLLLQLSIIRQVFTLTSSSTVLNDVCTVLMDNSLLISLVKLVSHGDPFISYAASKACVSVIISNHCSYNKVFEDSFSLLFSLMSCDILNKFEHVTINYLQLITDYLKATRKGMSQTAGGCDKLNFSLRQICSSWKHISDSILTGKNCSILPPTNFTINQKLLTLLLLGREVLKHKELYLANFITDLLNTLNQTLSSLTLDLICLTRIIDLYRKCILLVDTLTQTEIVQTVLLHIYNWACPIGESFKQFGCRSSTSVSAIESWCLRNKLIGLQEHAQTNVQYSIQSNDQDSTQNSQKLCNTQHSSAQCSSIQDSTQYSGHQDSAQFNVHDTCSTQQGSAQDSSVSGTRSMMDASSDTFVRKLWSLALVIATLKVEGCIKPALMIIGQMKSNLAVTSDVIMTQLILQLVSEHDECLIQTLTHSLQISLNLTNNISELQIDQLMIEFMYSISFDHTTFIDFLIEVGNGFDIFLNNYLDYLTSVVGIKQLIYYCHKKDEQLLLNCNEDRDYGEIKSSLVDYSDTDSDTSNGDIPNLSSNTDINTDTNADTNTNIDSNTDTSTDTSTDINTDKFTSITYTKTIKLFTKMQSLLKKIAIREDNLPKSKLTLFIEIIDHINELTEI